VNAAPSFTGNGSGIKMQGGTSAQVYFVYGGWIDDCNQAIHNSAGADVGVYIDDTVNQHWPDHSTEDDCVRKDKALAAQGVAADKLIVAAAPLSSPNWDFTPEGATYNALEWYPYCGSHQFLGPPPQKTAYITQWNFVFNEQDIGLGDGMCPATPQSGVKSLLTQIIAKHPALVLFY
jgi:hypothetical protein